MVLSAALDSDIETAARAEQTAVVLTLHREAHCVVVRHHDLRGVGRALVIALRKLLAQREFHRVVGGLEPGLLQRAFELVGVALEQVKRFAPLDNQARGGVAVAVDVELDVNAAEFRRIETDFEVLLASRRLRCDLDRDAAERNGCRGVGLGLKLNLDVRGRGRLRLRRGGAGRSG